MKTTNISKTKPNETKDWFRPPLHHPARKWILQDPHGWLLWVVNLYTGWPLSRQCEIPGHFPDGMLSATSITPVLVLLSVVGVGMQHCRIRNHVLNTQNRLVLNTCMDANMQLTINSFRQLFPDEIFPWLLVKSLTFPWQLSNSLTFSGFPVFPDNWLPWVLAATWASYQMSALRPYPLPSMISGAM